MIATLRRDGFHQSYLELMDHQPPNPRYPKRTL